MKLRVFFIFGVVICATTSLQARIGETPVEIIQRYGPIIKTSVVFNPGLSEQRGELHNKNGIDIFVVYEKGRAVVLHFRKSPSPDAWTSEEVKILLAANSGGGKWEQDASEAAGNGVRETKFFLSSDTYRILNAPVGKNLVATWARDFVEIEDTGYEFRLLGAEIKNDKDSARARLNGF